MFKRQTTGAVVCPSCGRLVGVQDAECFNCGQRNPGLWGYAPLLNKFGRNLGFTEIVLFGCAAMFIITLLGEPAAIGMNGIFNLLSPGRKPLFLMGASGALPVFGYGRWWTVLSAAWLHGSLLHIGMNMMWLRQLMPAVSQLYGVGRLVIIYTVASAGGFAATSVMGILPLPWPLQGAGFTVGASAPLFGLFGALIAYSQRAGTSHIGQQVWRWVIMFVVIGLLIPMIDNWAHMGGFAGGYLAARWLDPLKEETSKHYLGALACLVLTLASIIASFLHGAPLFQ